MSNKVEAVTLFKREEGAAFERTMKCGRHGDRFYLDDNELKEETAEVVEFDEPVSPHTLDDISDYPVRVQEFFADEDGDS